MSYDFMQSNGVEVLIPQAMAGLTALITTRWGGASSGPFATLNLGLHVGDEESTVVENRRRACAAAGVDLDHLVVPVQAHGPNVTIVDDSHRGCGARSTHTAIPSTDALVTSTPGVALMIMVADCVPIICWDPVNRVAGAIHAGWGGTVSRVTEAAVEAMVSLGTNPSDIIAFLGPAIAPERYQVGQDVVDRAIAGLGPEIASETIRPDGTGRFLFDLWAANTAILLEAGVPEWQITSARLDSGGDRFFSDRNVRPCGRFAAIANIPLPKQSGD